MKVLFCVFLLSIVHCPLSIAQNVSPPDFDSMFRAAPAFNENWDTSDLFAHRNLPVSEGDLARTLQRIDTVSFCPPVTGRVLSRYGRRGSRQHSGTDIKLALGQPVRAVWDGIVRISIWNRSGYGNIVAVRHASGLETWYAHLSERLVEAGEVVQGGQTIGYGGRTGRATGLHLHFETRFGGRTFDPESIIDFEQGSLRGHASPVDRVIADAVRSDTVKLVPQAVDGTQIAAVEESAVVSQRPVAEEVFHTVRGGDTLWALSRRYGTTVAAICTLNNISRSATLKLGRRLRVK